MSLEITGEEAKVVIENFIASSSNKPAEVYAIRAKGKDKDGKPYSRVRLFANRASTNDFLNTLEKYGQDRWDSVEVYIGAITWRKKPIPPSSLQPLDAPSP